MGLDNLASSVVSLAPAWVPGADNDPVFPIGGNYRDNHQREVFDALYDPRKGSEAVLNTNPTGAGKTVSWGAPIIRSGEAGTAQIAFATYPTRTLVSDQYRALLELFERYFGSDDPYWEEKRDYDLRTVNGEPTLTNGETEHPLNESVIEISTVNEETSTGSQLLAAQQTAIRRQRDGVPTIIIATPDVLTLMATNRYRDQEVNAIPSEMDAIIVDEFHLANPRAKRLLPFHLQTYLTSRYLNSLVFLSATPVQSDVQRLSRVFETQQVTNEVESQEPSHPAREVMPAARFGVASQRIFHAGYWLAKQIDELLEFYDETPGNQTVIIVDSVVEVEELATTLERETELDIGCVYGWERTGRQAVIETADIIVGNTAVEVGVDFDRVSRLICTGFDPNSALQRIGRMRAREGLTGCEILFITTPEAHQTLLDMSGEDRRLTRQELDDALYDALSVEMDRPYYDVLCGAYTRYLWFSAEQSLSEAYRPDFEEKYRSLSFRHFGPAMEWFVGQPLDEERYWGLLEQVCSKYESGSTTGPPVFEEMHSYRSSSLSCLVIDLTSEERLKNYGLMHLLRHRNGEFFPLDKVESRYEHLIGESITAEQRAFIQSVKRYACGAFVVTGRRSTPRKCGIRDFRFGNRKENELRIRKQNEATPVTIPDTLKFPEPYLDPPMKGVDQLELADEEILGQYIPYSVETTRRRFGLGEFASLMPLDESSCIALWQDAILTHSSLMSENK